MKLSVIIITLNEESNIRDCLESVKFADEIIVVDAGSSDRTVEIARSYTDRIFTPGWLGYSAAKEFALARARGEWILWIDADERVSEELKREILEAIDNPGKIVAFAFPRKSFFLNRWIRHSGWYPDYVIRLFKAGYGRFSSSLVHEGVMVDGALGRLKNPILHYTYPTLEKYFQKFNNYTTLAAQDLRMRGEKFSYFKLFFHPCAKFFKMYIQKLGFLDGVEGFILAVFSAFYVFVKYAKLKYADGFSQPEKR